MKRKKKSEKKKQEEPLKRNWKIYGLILGIIAILGVVGILSIAEHPVLGSDLTLSYEDGSPISAEKVILDGKELGSAPKGKISIEGIDSGEHQVIIIINGAKYSETFSYTGETISLSLKKPVKVNVVVWSKTGKTLSNIKVYSDGELKGTTNQDGTCSFMERPDTHTFRLQGEGLFYEEIKKVSQDSNSFTFKVEREFSIKIKVKDELTGDTIENAKIKLDGLYKGETSSNGILELKDVGEGSHNLEIEYNGVSKDKTVEVTLTKRSFEIEIKAPRTVILEVKDEETGKLVNNVRVSLDGIEKGYTTQDGTLKIENILPGSYRTSIAIPGYGTIDAGYIDVNIQPRVKVMIDMPNPVFSVGATIKEELQLPSFDEKGIATVELYNGGDVSSEDTLAIVSVYTIEDGKISLLDQCLIRFGGISKGEMKSKESRELDTSYWKDDDITVVVFDRNKYIPEQDFAVKLNLPGSTVDNLIEDAASYCSQSKEECAKVAGVFVGNVIKTVTG